MEDAKARARATAVAAGLLLGAPAYLATMNALISITTGLSLATIAAQVIPQFKEGKGYRSNYEG